MKPCLVFSGLMALVLTIASPVLAQNLTNDIVGTWKITSQVRKELVSGATANIFGEKPVGHIIYTKGGYVIFFFVADKRQGPASPNPTDPERVELFRSLAGASGTYKIEGKNVVSRYESSWHQLWTGAEIGAVGEVSGKTLTLTTAPFKSPQDGKDVVVVTTWERVE